MRFIIVQQCILKVAMISSIDVTDEQAKAFWLDNAELLKSLNKETINALEQQTGSPQNSP